jgi:hypothetical protein
MKSRRSPKAIFPYKELRAVPKFIPAVRTIIKCIGDHPTIFISPEPPLSTITGNLDLMTIAESVAKTHVTGSAAQRNVVYDKVVVNLRSLNRYVNRLANNAGKEETAIAIIEASGFRVRKKGIHTKPKVAAKWGDKEGEIKLRAVSFGRNAYYMWQASTDGQEWETVKITLVANCKVDSFSPGTKMYFRLHVVGKKKEEITEQVSIIIQ